MGNSLDRFGGYDSSESASSSGEKTLEDVNRKRKRNDSVSDDSSPERKLTKLDTAKYVYERLFLQGENSDIVVKALSQSWNLHKLYLQQCNYFESLINRNWKDSEKQEIEIEIPDENVTEDGLHSLFGSLYNNEIVYKPGDLPSIIASASLFQLESVLNRCDEELSMELNEKNVIQSLHLANRYGLPKVQKTAFALMKWNFWRLMRNRVLLNEIDEETLLKLLSSPELLIVDGEEDLYSMIKMYIYLKSCPSAVELSDEQFKKDMASFLSSNPPGYLFVNNIGLFSTLRLAHLLNTSACIALIEKDGLIPGEIVRGVMVDLWKNVVENEESPGAIANVSDEDFYLNCVRLGRVIDSSTKCWRWSGYNHGVDLIFNYNNGLLTMRRNVLNQPTPYSINLKMERAVHFRVVICDEHGHCLHDSGKQLMVLRIDQSIVIWRLPDKNAPIPLTIHFFHLSAQSPPPSFLYINQYAKKHLS